MKRERKTTNKKGVSLIVLVITVIVMVILAGTIILTLDNAGIIERAENAVTEYNINEITNLANVAWAEAYMNGARTEQELEEAVMANLVKNNITEDEYAGYTINVTTKGVTVDKIVPIIREKIPEGGTYYVGVTSVTTGDYTGATATYIAGQEFPQTVNEGDVYVYGDYEYRYNYEYAPDNIEYDYNWVKIEDENGWGVRVLNQNKKEYGAVLDNINGEKLVSMRMMFVDLSAGDWNLADDFIIPQGVTDVSSMFSNSTINTLPDSFTIPEGVTDVSAMFGLCESLEKLPNNFKLPSTVKNAVSMFSMSGIRSSLPVDFLNEGITDISNMFYDFYGTIPEGFIVPSSVTDMISTFYAAGITGTIILNATPTSYGECFSLIDMSKVTLAGSCDAELKQKIANTGINGDQVTIVD